MKVAICVQEDSGLESSVDQRFGRAFGFLVVDSETRKSLFIANNQNLNAAQGAGIQAAQNVLDGEIDAVATGHCGPKAFSVLAAGGVKVFLNCSGTASQVLDDIDSSKLMPAENADVEGHW